VANEVVIRIKSKDDTEITTVTAKITQKAEREFAKAGDKSSRSFGSSVKKWFTGEGGGLFTEIGKSGGTVFGSGLLGALKTPILGPLLVGVIGAAVATAMPAVGAIAGGALVTGFGAGLAGLGIVFAAKSENVQRVWSDTLDDMGRDMQLLSRPFEDTLIQIAGFFRRTVDAFNPHLAAAFEDMAQPVEDFVDQGARALEEFIPAIDPITDAFNAVLAALGPALQGALSDVSDGLIRVADSVRENPEALADMVEGLGSITSEVLGLIGTLNDINGQFEELTGGLSLVDVTMGTIEGSIVGLTSAFSGLSAIVGAVDAALNNANADTAANGRSMNDAADMVTKAAQAYDKTTEAAHATAPSIRSVTASVTQQNLAVHTLLTSMRGLVGLALSLSGAQIATQQAIDDATQSIKDNGKTLDISTEKGRANRTALNNLATALNQETEAMLRSGKGSVTAAGNAETSRGKFIALARQMGLSKTEAQRLASQLIAIPNVSREAKLTANKKDLEAKLAAAKRELDNPKLTATKRAQITATIKALQAQLAAAQRAIDALRGKTVTVTTRHVEERIIRTQSGATGGRPPTHAHGGMARGTFIAGEAGPEKITLMGGRAQVTPAGNTQRNLMGGLLGNLVGTEFTGSTQQLRQMRQLGSWWPARQRQLALARERAADQRRLTAERQELAGRRSAELARLAVQRRAHLVHAPSAVGSTQQPIRISFDASNSDPLGRAVMEWIRKQIKIEGGDVQVVLGK
jgi:hypothetical protein